MLVRVVGSEGVWANVEGSEKQKHARARVRCFGFILSLGNAFSKLDA